VIVDRRISTMRVDRTDARRERCEQIVRANFPTAEEILVRFFGPFGTPIADVWHRDAGERRCKVVRIEEGES
jgi:hypothetical protein